MNMLTAKIIAAMPVPDIAAARWLHHVAAELAPINAVLMVGKALLDDPLNDHQQDRKP